MHVERTYDRRNRRGDITMTTEEIAAFLADGPDVMALGTLNQDGSIHLTTVAYAVIDGAIWTKSKARSQKVVNLRRHPRASCLLSQGDDDYETMRGLSARGAVTVVEDADTVEAVTRSITSRFADRADAGAVDADTVRRLSHGYVAIRFDDPTFVTWDHRKLVASP